VLYDFARGGGFGIYPSGELILDNASHLLGTTVAGGNGLGTVFELSKPKKVGYRRWFIASTETPTGQRRKAKSQ